VSDGCRQVPKVCEGSAGFNGLKGSLCAATQASSRGRNVVRGHSGALRTSVATFTLTCCVALMPDAPAGAWRAQDEEVAAFAKAFATACARRDRPAVASMIRFPIVVDVSGSRIPFQNAAELFERFDLVMTPDLCRSISAAAARVTPEGATLGKNLVELRRVNGTLKATAMSVTLTPAGATARSADALPNGDIPLSVRVGPRPTQRSGTLEAGGSDAYLIRASAQQLVEIRIEGVPGRDVVARLVDARSNTPVDARADQGVRVWAGRVAAGEYRIQVVRRSAGPDTLTYTLAVSLR